MDGEGREWFRRFSCRAARFFGAAPAFFGALSLIAVWASLGPTFHFSQTWQLVINTLTTIVTFLLVFLIQNTQNRDAQAIQLKLDELIRCTKKARNLLIDLENMTDEELSEIHREFEKLRLKAQLRQKKLNREGVPQITADTARMEGSRASSERPMR